MAKTDPKLRKTILEDWIAEIQTSQGRISNDYIEGTGLAPVRKEIMVLLERAKQFAESKKPGFEPFAAVASASKRQAKAQLTSDVQPLPEACKSH